MNKRLAGCLVVASAAALALLPACASRPAAAPARTAAAPAPKTAIAPAPKTAAAPAPAVAAPRVMDLSQIPPLDNAPLVYESSFAPGWSNVQPSAADLAYHAMLMGTDGMTPGEVAAGPKKSLPARDARLAPGALWAKPKLVLRALQPDAGPVQTEGEEAWKKSLPPLPHLAGK
jgi:hypothetical protein